MFILCDKTRLISSKCAHRCTCLSGIEYFFLSVDFRMGEGSVPFSWSTVIGLNESEALWHAVHPSGGEEDQKQTL